MSATPVGSADVDEHQLDARLPQLRERLVGEVVRTDRAEQRDVRAEAGARDRLVRPLPARNARERRTRHGLARPRESLAARHEIEVDRPDDDDARRHGA